MTFWKTSHSHHGLDVTQFPSSFWTSDSKVVNLRYWEDGHLIQLECSRGEHSQEPLGLCEHTLERSSPKKMGWLHLGPTVLSTLWLPVSPFLNGCAAITISHPHLEPGTRRLLDLGLEPLKLWVKWSSPYKINCFGYFHNIKEKLTDHTPHEIPAKTLKEEKKNAKQ